MRWTIPCIVACSLLLADVAAAATPVTPVTPASLARHRRYREAACVSCHREARGVLTGVMGTRAPERAFAHRAMGHGGDAFFAASCTGCHVTRCADCHGSGAAFAAKPADDACLACHRGYWTGWEYHGHAVREDHERYQRGPLANGEHALKMLADVHAERGIGCADCHTMRSLQEGRRTGRTCRDCHPKPSPRVPEHAIVAHLDKMECWACHSAWGSQEYGTFLVRPRTPEQQQAFSPLPQWGEWRKSAYLKRQDAPPLGLDARGLVSPLRPQFILFATDPKRGWENRLLVSEWKPFFPHTIRRGTTTCLGCHDTPRRFLLENDRDRIYRPDEDGLPMRSFWNREGQVVRGGAFFPPDRYRAMNRKSPTFVREHLKQWQDILDRVDRSSAR
jgi:hypothetical protein